MKKKNVWVASDGREFTDQAACIEYERVEGFRQAASKFVALRLDVSISQAVTLVDQMSVFWNLIRDHPDEFQEILDIAKPKKLRGRPRTKHNETPEKPAEIVNTSVPIVEPEIELHTITLRGELAEGPNRGGDTFSTMDDALTPEPAKEAVASATPKKPGPWRAGRQ